MKSLQEFSELFQTYSEFFHKSNYIQSVLLLVLKAAVQFPTEQSSSRLLQLPFPSPLVLTLRAPWYASHLLVKKHSGSIQGCCESRQPEWPMEQSSACVTAEGWNKTSRALSGCSCSTPVCSRGQQITSGSVGAWCAWSQGLVKCCFYPLS